MSCLVRSRAQRTSSCEKASPRISHCEVCVSSDGEETLDLISCTNTAAQMLKWLPSVVVFSNIHVFFIYVCLDSEHERRARTLLHTLIENGAVCTALPL